MLRVSVSAISIPKPEKHQCGDASFAERLQIGEKVVHVLCVADGVSTCDSDHIASKTAIEIIQQTISNSTDSVEQTIKDAILSANDTLSLGFKHYKRLLTTLSILAYVEQSKCAYYFNIGDSRIYQWDGVHFNGLTKDDSKRFHLRNHDGTMKHKNGQPLYGEVLTKSLGFDSNLTVELQTLSVTENSCFILCSDGFHRLFNQQQLMKQLVDSADLVKESQHIAKQIESSIQDDASFACLRINFIESQTLSELLKKEQIDSVAVRQAVLDELQAAINQGDNVTCEVICKTMQEVHIFPKKTELIYLLDQMVKAKLKASQTLGLIVRKI